MGRACVRACVRVLPCACYLVRARTCIAQCARVRLFAAMRARALRCACTCLPILRARADEREVASQFGNDDDDDDDDDDDGCDDDVHMRPCIRSSVHKSAL
eukprot:1830637-Pleurochrysis_carterae.AAC.2